MRKITILRIIILILIIMWVLMTFSFSNQNGTESSSLSREIARKFTTNEEQINIIEPYIRKIAHLSEYAIGGILFLLMFMTYKLSDTKKIIFSISVGMEYAAIDEIHQLFIDGRSGKISDVFIDTIGVAMGVCVLMLFYKLLKKLWKKGKMGENVYDKFQTNNRAENCKNSW